MIEEHHGFDRVVILSDESANWQIAGLRQLDRLVLGIDEFDKAMETANKIEIVVFWKPEIPLSERLLSKHQRITRVRLTDASCSIEPDARLLLKLPITPNAWTMLIFALAPVAFVFLVRGDYTGFLAGTALFQLINILDGCDGEIARAKYLDSERGRRLDAFCDFVANLIFVLCLGIGLFRQPSESADIRFVYLLESLVTFLIMAGGFGRYLMPLFARDTTRVVSLRQEDFHLAERFFGRALTAFIHQSTQR